MSTSATRNSNSLSWLVVLVAGVVVLVVVAGLELSSRLDAGQRVLDGARPAFTPERVEGNVPAVAMVFTATQVARITQP